MKPSATQTLQAIQNHHQPARTPGGRVQDILDHICILRNDKPGSGPVLLHSVVEYHDKGKCYGCCK